MPRALPITIPNALLLAWFAFLGQQIWSEGYAALWDFQTYYAAAKAHQAGLDPYDLEVLSKVIGHALRHPYVYPPWSLYAFWPFAYLDYGLAAGIFLTAKVACMAILLAVWQRLLGAQVLLLLLLPLGFAGATLIDLRAGNISMFEQTCLWLGFACYARGNLRCFVGLTIVAASFKILPIAFLGLLLVGPDERRPGLLTAALAAAVSLCLAQAWTCPELFSAFIDSLDLADERGSINPCSYAFWGSVIHILGAGDSLTAGQGMRWSLYAIGVAAVAWMSWPAVSKHGKRDLPQILCLATLCYALIMPRFKDYSYLLLVPAACAQCLAFGGPWRPWIVAALICLPTHSLAWISSEGLRGIASYYPLYCALALWFLALRIPKPN